MHSQMNKPCFSSCSSKIKAASPLGSLKKFMIASTLPVLFCRRAGLLWKILVALARQPGVLSAENLLNGSACVVDPFSAVASISLVSMQVAFYAAKDCQRQHWKDHRSVCRAISSGTWHTVVLDRYPANTGLQTGSILSINRYDDLQDKSTTKKTGTGMPQTHTTVNTTWSNYRCL